MHLKKHVIRERLARAANPPRANFFFKKSDTYPGDRIPVPDQWIRDKDRMAAIRERIARAEKHYRAKDGTELTFFGLLSRLSDERVKASKDDDRKTQDLVMLLARKAGVL